ncbi:hypothetical protein [Blastococcus sp. SYSU DS0828]
MLGDVPGQLGGGVPAEGVERGIPGEQGLDEPAGADGVLLEQPLPQPAGRRERRAGGSEAGGQNQRGAPTLVATRREIDARIACLQDNSAALGRYLQAAGVDAGR